MSAVIGGYVRAVSSLHTYPNDIVVLNHTVNPYRYWCVRFLAVTGVCGYGRLR